MLNIIQLLKVKPYGAFSIKMGGEQALQARLSEILHRSGWGD